MKKIKLIYNYLVYFIIGNIIFNTIYVAVKIIIINKIGGHEKYISNLLLSFKETLIIYSIIYLIFIIIDIIKKKKTIKILNEKLKKRGEKNEK